MIGPILIVEDHDTSRLVYRHLSRLMDLDIDLVETCQQACQLAPTRHYKLVIMDIGLPDLDGRECTSLMRQMNPSLPPVLAITAYAMCGDRESILASGLDDYLPKPFTIEQFAEKLQHWLGESGFHFPLKSVPPVAEAEE